MRPDPFMPATGYDLDVRVSALRPRPLLMESISETALPAVGRPPRKRHRRTVVRVAVGLMAVAAAARFGFEQWDRTARHTGGPVSAGGGIVGGPADVGHPVTFGGFLLQNRAKTAAVLENVRIVGVTGGLEVIDVRTTPLPGTANPKRNPSDDERSDSLADRHVVPVAATRSRSGEPNEGLRLIISVRATVPGVARARGVEVTYRVGHRRYRRYSESSMYVCAPPGQFPLDSCPGDAEGQFGTAVADFPVAH